MLRRKMRCIFSFVLNVSCPVAWHSFGHAATRGRAKGWLLTELVAERADGLCKSMPERASQ